MQIMKKILVNAVLPNLKAIGAFVVLCLAQSGINVPTDVADYFVSFAGALLVWLIPNVRNS